MAVASKYGSEETVTSQYVVPLIELSFDEEEGLGGEDRACGRKTKLQIMGLRSAVATQKVKRLKLCDDNTPPSKEKELETLRDKVNINEGEKMREAAAPIVIDISDDSSD
ncbi:hypothetical protein F511_06163 [Dorcoceras hygrometricum]|uniref:Uncharacterized protein n=1 Tax=Dorcoceras hygrometricum TaxID=472368 RepID=A0A2Z7CIK2_9LAMI|nr:hypothetical protein F511_06163 [Dorcoceras hygrometricum]